MQRASPSGSRLALKASGLILLVDQLTKWWAETRLEAGACHSDTCIEVFGTPVRFHLLYNTGAAFSAGEGLGWLIGPLAVVMAVYLIVLANRTHDRLSVVGLGMVAGGAVGNVVDRAVRSDGGFLNGGVIDFIDFRFWPVFNVADIAVVCGIGLLLIRQWSPAKPNDEESAIDIA